MKATILHEEEHSSAVAGLNRLEEGALTLGDLGQVPVLDNGAFDALLDEFLSNAVAKTDEETRTVDGTRKKQRLSKERVCSSCKKRLRDEDFEPDRKTCRECLRKQRRRHARKVRAELVKRWKGNAGENDGGR